MWHSSGMNHLLAEHYCRRRTLDKCARHAGRNRGAALIDEALAAHWLVIGRGGCQLAYDKRRSIGDEVRRLATGGWDS